MHDRQAAEAKVRKAMARIAGTPAGLTELARRCGVSEPTIRKVATEGRASSWTTALAIESGTDGELAADEIAGPESRGYDLYRREPARSIAAAAVARRMPTSRLLADLGLDHGDLDVFMNAPPDKFPIARRRIASILDAAGFPSTPEQTGSASS